MDYNTEEYKKLKFTGSVTVSLEHGRVIGPWNILIMGPTGAGKSTFIEALGWDGGQQISSNRLDSFTQKLSTYRVNNVTSVMGSPIRLVDSPGFADTKTSESAIVSMLKKWLEDNKGVYFSRILYLLPITHARFPGSQRQVLKTFLALTGIETSKSITIITTMWDSISGDHALKRAEGTFKHLQDDIWKEYIHSGAQIVKFYNTQQSALSNLNVALGAIGERVQLFHLENMVKGSLGLYDMPFGANLYADLHDRVLNLQSARSTLLLDLEQAELERNSPLRGVLLQRLQEVDKDLARFRREMEDLGPPPGVTPASGLALGISDAIGTTGGKEGLVDHDVGSSHILGPAVTSSLAAAANPPSPSPTRPPQSLALDTTTSVPDNVAQERGPANEQAQLRQSRIVRAISSMKCWGNSVGGRHDQN